MRSILVTLALLVVALVLWFAFVREPSAPLQDPPSNTTAAPVSVVETSAPPEAEIAAPAQESPERAVVVEATPTSTRARLEVLVVAKGTQRPLVRARIGLGLTEPGSTTREVNRSIGTLGEILWTDGDGSAVFEVDPGHAMQLTARGGDTPARPAYSDVEALRPGETRSIVVEMEFEPNLVFFGRVLDRETRDSIAGARIIGEEPPGTADYGATDAGGLFRIAIRTWNTVGLRIRAPGFAEHWVGPIAGHDTAETALEILMDRAPKLTVEVLTADRAPLANATVRFESWISDMSSGASTTLRTLDALSWSAATDTAGVATFDELPPGAKLRGSVLRGNKLLRSEADPLTLTPGETRRVTWVLGTGGSIHGVVREEDGTPARDFEIWLQRATTESPTYFRSFDVSQGRRIAHTDGSGAYRFEDVAPGGWWIGPKHPGTTGIDPTQAAVPIGEYVSMASEALEHDITLARGLVIRGRVVGPDGQTLVNAQVHASRPADQMYVDSSTDTSPNFVVGPLSPGRWTLFATGMTPGLRSERVEAEAGDTDVVLRLLELGRVRVQVVDAAGAKVPGTSVSLSGEGSSSSSQTDAQGTREFPGLPPGTYVVSANTSDGRWAARTGIAVQSGRGVDVELALEPGVRARVRNVAAPSGTRFFVERNGVGLGAVHIAPGQSADMTAPIGASTLRAFAPSTGYVDREIVVAAGTTPEFVYDGGWK